MKTSEEHVRFLKYKMSEQNNQLVEKGASSTVYQELVIVPEEELDSASGMVERLTTQHKAD